MIRNVKRFEDMSSKGHLHLMLDNDGDVIVSVISEENGLFSIGENIEFCTIGSGGGGSPKTYNALRNLMIAMDEDNKDSSCQGRTFINRDSCPKCGCEETNNTGNMLTPPDHYQKWHCHECGWLVGMIDNSPYYNCWDFENYDVEI